MINLHLMSSNLGWVQWLCLEWGSYWLVHCRKLGDMTLPTSFRFTHSHLNKLPRIQTHHPHSPNSPNRTWFALCPRPSLPQISTNRAMAIPSLAHMIHNQQSCLAYSSWCIVTSSPPPRFEFRLKISPCVARPSPFQTYKPQLLSKTNFLVLVIIKLKIKLILIASSTNP